MPGPNGHVRGHVVREARSKINLLASEGMSVEEIGKRLSGHRTLNEAEQGLIELLARHAVAHAKGHY